MPLSCEFVNISQNINLRSEQYGLYFAIALDEEIG